MRVWHPAQSSPRAQDSETVTEDPDPKKKLHAVQAAVVRASPPSSPALPFLSPFFFFGPMSGVTLYSGGVLLPKLSFLIRQRWRGFLVGPRTTIFPQVGTGHWLGPRTSPPFFGASATFFFWQEESAAGEATHSRRHDFEAVGKNFHDYVGADQGVLQRPRWGSACCCVQRAAV